MNDEIKEILNKLKSLVYDDYCLEFSVDYIERKEEKLLLDYITNLQQENERLKELCDEYEEEHSNEFKIWKEERHELLDYKSRCEKAIEYNNQIIKDTRDFYRPTTDIIYSGDSLIEIATNNINILQNGSEDNE